METTNGYSAGGGHLVDLRFGVASFLLQQKRCALHCLGHQLLGLIRLKAQFHTARHGGPDIAQRISDATGGQRGSCSQLRLRQQKRLSHLPKQVLNYSFLVGTGIERGVAGHGLPYGYCRIGHGPKQWETSSTKSLQALQTKAGCQGDQEGTGCQFRQNFSQYLLQLIGLNHQKDHCGLTYGSAIVAAGLHPTRSQGRQLVGLPAGNPETGRLCPARVQQSFGYGSAQMAAAYYGCLIHFHTKTIIWLSKTPV